MAKVKECIISPYIKAKHLPKDEETRLNNINTEIFDRLQESKLFKKVDNQLRTKSQDYFKALALKDLINQEYRHPVVSLLKAPVGNRRAQDYIAHVNVLPLQKETIKPTEDQILNREELRERFTGLRPTIKIAQDRFIPDQGIELEEYKEIHDTIYGPTDPAKINLDDKSGQFKLLNASAVAAQKKDIDFQFKAIKNILSNLPKVEGWFKQIKDKDKFWTKLQQDLQIPKDQIELLKQQPGSTIDEILSNFSANYSFTVEVNNMSNIQYSKNKYARVSKEEVYAAIEAITDKEDPLYHNFNEVDAGEEAPNEMASGINKYGLELNRFIEADIDRGQNLENIINDLRQHYHSADGEWLAFNREGYGMEIEDRYEYEQDRGDYSNLTVPGGTNYTENEIATPLITPSIKGHAQFSTSNGIGWFRSDDKTEGSQLRPKDHPILGEQDIIKDESYGGVPTKTRRILEVQSDLFQKGRDQVILEKTLYDAERSNNLFNTIMDMPLEELQKYLPEKDFLRAKELKEIGQSGNYKEEDEELFERDFNDIMGKALSKFIGSDTKNQFLQLLNKDNNWVNFFVKAILQSSARETIIAADPIDVQNKIDQLKASGELQIKC